MVARLCEVAYEYLPLGDVVLVPDDPKPLIMAMSLVPQLLGKEGVVWMHVSRNPKCREFVNVSATGAIIGFSSYDDGKEMVHSLNSVLECE